MKVQKKSAPGLVFDGATGQVVESSVPELAPADVPEIVERYQRLVGKAIALMEAKAVDNQLQARDINSIAALGRSVGMLQVMEAADISRVGDKAVKELPTSTLRRLVGAVETDAEIIE